MAWQTGIIDITAPDESHHAYVRTLRQFMCSSHVSAGAINAGGTGYTIGEILTVAGGTLADAALPAQFEVTDVSSGVVTEVRLVNCGGFSVEPATLTGNSVTGGTGSGCTLDLTMDSWMTAAIQSGGTGYSVSDVLTLSGGTNGGTPATFEVTAVSGGVVTAVRLLTVGDYSELPADPASTTGGGGSGCTLNLTRNGYLLLSSDYSDDQTPFEEITQGVNTAGTDPIIGFRTAAAPRLQGFVATAYSNLLDWESQPGSSPTADPTSTTTGDDSTIPMVTQDCDFYFFVSGRRVILIMHTGTTYEMGYFGCFTPFVDDPAARYPAPFIAAGTVSRSTETVVSAENQQHHIFIRPVGTGSANGAFLRDSGGVWRQMNDQSGDSPVKMWPFNDATDIFNGDEADAPDASDGVGTIAPASRSDIFSDRFFSTDAVGDSCYAPFGFGGRTYFCEPYTMFQDEPGAVQLIGEVEGIFAIPGRGLTVEDIVRDQNGFDHQVFANLNSTTLDDFYTVIRN